MKRIKPANWRYWRTPGARHAHWRNHRRAYYQDGWWCSKSLAAKTTGKLMPIARCQWSAHMRLVHWYNGELDAWLEACKKPAEIAPDLFKEIDL